ncbi:cobalt ECF transporter T component CbiQ [Vagococcus fessus]|nr:cobalt ECF transporter T component CbiQ [Vagococcus fessus]
MISFSPMKKTLLYLIVLLLALISQPIIQVIIVFFIGGVTMYVARLSLKKYLKWFLLPLPFLVISLVTIMVTISSSSSDFNHSVEIGKFYLGMSSESIVMAYHLCLRSLSCLCCTYFFIFTVPFQQIIYVMTKLKLPSFLIEIIMLMYRFIFIFMEVTLKIHTSQQLRFGYNNLKTSYRSMGQLMQTLVVYMIDHYQQMKISLEIKFYDGEFPLGG